MKNMYYNKARPLTVVFKNKKRWKNYGNLINLYLNSISTKLKKNCPKDPTTSVGDIEHLFIQNATASATQKCVTNIRQINSD